jgi:hypothetical protein
MQFNLNNFYFLGRLVYAGLFKTGKPYGPSWKGLEGGGFLYGCVGHLGKFEGPQNAFIYPDMETALSGSWKDGQMIEAIPADIKEVVMDESGAILRLRFTKAKHGAPTFKYWPSSRSQINVPTHQQDPYEEKCIIAGSSSMSDNAGDGLFLRKDVKANTTVAFYNGIRVKPGEVAPYQSHGGYQIWVDWKLRDVTMNNISLYMDRYTAICNVESTRSLDHGS